MTGKATRPAIAKATDRLPQNSTSPTPASIAPGIARTITLSTISMVAIESVSEARAIGMTVATARPARSNGRLVSA